MIRATTAAILLTTTGTAIAQEVEQESSTPTLEANEVEVSPSQTRTAEIKIVTERVVDEEPILETAPPQPEEPQVREITLPANSEVVLRMVEELTTKGGRAKEGQVFRLTVAYDVKVDGITVIPTGTPATGEVTMKTGRAVFGKSGKMEIALRSINLDGQRVEITGEYRQEGDGDTLAAVGAVVLAAPLLVITGKSAVIPRGREMVAYTVSPVTVTTTS